MTKYRDSTESVDTDENTLEVRYFWNIKCDACGQEVTIEDIEGFVCDLTNKLEFWYADNKISQGQGFHLCPSCRYAGAAQYQGIQLAEKSLVDLAEMVPNIRRQLVNTKNNVHDNGYRLGRVKPLNKFSSTELEHAKHFQTLAYHALGSLESSLNHVMKALHVLGWPIINPLAALDKVK